MLDIEDLHPLRNTASMAHILPYFPFTLCFKKNTKKNLRFALRKAILAEMSNIKGDCGKKKERELKVSELDEEMQD